MQQSAVEWLIENLMINGLIRLTKEQHRLYKEITDLAKQMEKEQTEISDEEIYKEAEKHYRGLALTRFVQGAKWYREQLKQKL